MTDSPRGGRWYFVLPIVSVGFLSWVPFLHAAARLDRPGPRREAAVFGAVAAAVLVWISVVPVDERGEVTGVWAVLDTLAVVVTVSAAALACMRLVPLRREVYGARPAGAASPSDEALAAALAARERRDAARGIAADDPLLARDLGIGRPDLGGDYDDGGLVELNTAPAETIAQVCGLPEEVAAGIVAARTECGGFLAVDDVFGLVDVRVEHWDALRDRGLVVR